MRTIKANQSKANNRRALGRRIAQEIAVIRAALKRRGLQYAPALPITDDED
ncbi:hypothetical protein H6F77_01380 [Microcoleus sp. FACHB-831]|uniref:hypothetical protein n=1 Tax=Microcoleus sp. FACHB-831 TaxID=2692827 RepID=UPI001684F427|nr:hypothetical protein [Microcoleus sp. FACHB-831]MBD1919773.1 hypothetical protein [Microcoleus sp. FACHB-831]